MRTLTKDFLAQFLCEDEEGFIEQRAIKDGVCRPDFAADTREAFAFFSKHRDSHDMYFGVAMRRSRGDGSQANLAYSFALWADVDAQKLRTFATPTEALDAFPHPPSIVVSSGTEDNLHVYWLLEEPFDLRTPENVETFRGHLRGIAEALEADSACTDASRILRLPNSKNWKHGKPRWVDVRVWHPERLYAVKDFPVSATAGGKQPASVWGARYYVARQPLAAITTPWLQEILDSGYDGQFNPDRSSVDWKVVMRMFEWEEYEPEEILWTVMHSKARIGEKRDRDREAYWQHTIHKCAIAFEKRRRRYIDS